MSLAESVSGAYRSISDVKSASLRKPLRKRMMQVLQKVSSRKFCLKSNYIMYWFRDGSAMKVWPRKRKVRVMK